MALSRVKTWNAAETLTASDLNAEFNNICNHFGSLDNDDIDSTATYTMGELIVGSGIASADGGQLHVHTATAGTIQASADADEAVFENSGASGVTILSGATSTGNIAFGDSGDADNGLLKYTHGATPTLGITVNATAVQSIAAAATTLAHDLAIYQDANNADSQIALGTSATEALFVEALNGGSNKTLEELRFTTKTASGTANHGKMSFYIDEVNVGNINDAGITLESGMVFTGNVTGNASGTAATVTGGTQAAITAAANLVTVGTIGTGVWQGTAVALAYGGTGLVGATDGKIVIADGSGAPVLLDVGSSTAITVLGTVATGTWQGTAVASAYLDADTAHLSTTQTFTGAKTFTGNVTGGVDGTGIDLKLFGDSPGAYLEWDQSEDQLRIMGASADATTSTGKLLLATSLVDINANDVLGKIDFQAPHEAGGTDATTIAASIQAIAQGTFSASVNATDLIFSTGSSGAASEKFRFTSDGELGVGGANYGTDGQVLTSTGSGTACAWESVAAGFASTDAHTWTADQTFNDNVKVTLGTGGDADLYYDGTDVVLDPSVEGTGNFVVQVASSGADPNVKGLMVESSSSAAITIGTGSATEGMLHFADSEAPNSGRIVYAHNENDMYFSTAATERMRIDSAGKVGIGLTGPSASLHVKTTTAITSITSTSTSATSKGMILSWSGVTPDNNTQMFLHCTDGTADRLYIYSDGDVANHDGTYGTISDVKFKQDIADVRSYWSDFKSLQYRKFRHKTDVEANADAPYRLGLIAQEVETIFPALVPESPDADIETQGDPILDESGEPVLDDDGNPTYETVSTPSGTTHKWVKSSIVEGPIMGSVVQELQTRLEAAEAKITALESA